MIKILLAVATMAATRDDFPAGVLPPFPHAIPAQFLPDLRVRFLAFGEELFELVLSHAVLVSSDFLRNL